MTLIDAAIAHSRTTIACLLLILIAGTVAFQEIPKEAEPDVDIPVIYIHLQHEGISPDAAERLLLKPLEQELRILEGIEDIRSSAFEGGASVVLEFDAKFDADTAMTQVREKVDAAKSKLPEDTQEPDIQEVNLSLFPIIVVTLSGNLPERELLQHAKRLRDDLERLSAVLEVDIVGDREELVEIVIDPLLLQSYSLNAEAIISLVQRSNRLIAAGSVDTGAGQFAVKLPGMFESLGDILNMPVKISANNVVRVRDVAVVQRTFKDRTTYARLDGQPAIALAFTKRIGTNAIDMIEAMREIVEEAQQDWPENLTAGFSQDRSWRIRTRLSELRNSLMSAILLVMVMVIATLGVRSALLVGIAIPGSFLLAVLALAGFGLSVNTAVLYAFVMAVGLLVDGAIVVAEQADQYIKSGIKREQAYAQAAKRMAWPIIASTATTLAAFLPLLFWPGIVGEYIKFLPLTMLLTLTAALLMALVFLPVLGAKFLGAASGKNSTKSSETLEDNATQSRLVKGYVGFLKVVLRHPGKVVMISIAVLIWSFWIYSQYGRGVEFFPTIEPSNALVLVHARGNLSLQEKRQLALEVEQIVLTFDAFETVYTRIGQTVGRNNGGDVIASINLEFKEWDERAPAAEILQELRQLTAQLPGIVVEIREQKAGPQRGKPIHLEVSAEQAQLIAPAVAKIRRFFDGLDGLHNIEDSRPPPGIEWEIRVDRAEATKYGVDVTVVGHYLQLLTKGMVLGQYRTHDSDEEIDIVVRYPPRYRTLERFDGLRIRSEHGLVPISAFTERLPQPRTGSIQRINGQRALTVMADVEDDVLVSDMVTEIKSWLVSANLGPANAVSVSIRGEDEEQDEARTFLLRAFATALFIMAVILVTQFNSFYSAFLILFAVVMSTIGVRLGLLIIDQPFGIIMSGIGVIALAGIVVNNNIILIDTYDRLRKQGIDAVTALLQTGAQRLRPVLLTTVTTILGLLPMVLQANIDYLERSISYGAPSAQYWVQMSSAIVFGLAFATLLTLVVTPAALLLRANFQQTRQQMAAVGQSISATRLIRENGVIIGCVMLTGIIAAWIFIPQIILVRIIEIGLRQTVQQTPSAWFQALEWAGFWSLIVLTAAYAYWKNAHVRVDIVRDYVSPKIRAWIEIIGYVFLLLPVCAIVLYFGWDFVLRSYYDEESSGALLGSPTRWIFKAMMLLCFLQLLLVGAVVTVKNIRFLRGQEAQPYPLQKS